MFRLTFPLTIATAMAASLANAQEPAARCEGRVTVERGDTISAIAERCGLTERRLLAANPDVESSVDLVVGQDLATRSEATNTGEKLWGELRSAAGETSDALEGVARGLNSTASDILERNPDLRNRVESLGTKLGLTGPSQAGSVTVSPDQKQSKVTITATGLPADQTVSVNVGAIGLASETVGEARTTDSGSLNENLELPEWLPRSKPAVVTIVSAEQKVLARSREFFLQ